MRKTFSFFLVVSAAYVAMPFFVGAQTGREAREMRDERALREIPEIRGARQGAFAQDAILVRFRGEERAERVPLEEGETVERALERFAGRADVTYVEPDYIAHAFSVPNDPLYQYQWHFDSAGKGGVGMEEAWDVSNGSGVVVAVIDTGVAYEDYTEPSGKRFYRAPDLANTSFVAGYDFINNDAHANDDQGHGTHVAGTIAQSTGNGLGVAGIAYGASVMPIKVLDASGNGAYSAIANGIRFAADNGAKVINLSLGGSSASQTLEDALAYAYGKGVRIIAASRNNGATRGSYPAAYNAYVIAVGATRYDEQRASYSNYGSALDIVAPGGQMCTTSSTWSCVKNDQNSDGYGDGVLQQTFSGAFNNFGYYFYQGTSMATPHVAGAAALVIAKGNATTPNSVRAALETTAKDLGAAGRDNTYGYGLLNVSAALGYAAVSPPPPAPPPPPTPTPPPPSPTPPPGSPTPPPQPQAVVNIDMSSSGSSLWRATASMTVSVNGAPLSGATLKGLWSGLSTQQVSGTTNTSGKISFRTTYLFGAGTARFTVTEIAKGGVAYQLGGETTDVISKIALLTL